MYYFETLLFLVAPQISPFDFGEESVHSGTYIQVYCIVKEGDLPIAIEWMLNRKPLKDYSEISVISGGKRSSSLSIESVQYEHAGNYTCKTKNRAGETEFTAQLLVNGY